MTQTLCANLRFDPELLKELNSSFSPTNTIGCLEGTSYSILSSERDNQCPDVMRQVRNQFYKVISGLTTIESPGTTVDEEWPNAIEFKDWASEDCIEFCNTHGLLHDLRKCKRALTDTFSNIITLSADLGFYQEIDVEDIGHVVIRLEIATDRQTYRNEYKSWINWIIENISDENRMLLSVSIDRT